MPRSLNLGEIYKTVEGVKNVRLRNKILKMEEEDKLKKQATAEARNRMAQEFIRGRNVEPGYDDDFGMEGAPPENLMASQYGEAPQQDIPPYFDKKAYGEALLRSGDIEGAEQVKSEKKAELKAELDRVAKTYALNPIAGVRAWNEGLLGEAEGKIEHLGVKDGMQININQTTGEVIGVDKRSGEVKVLREGKPVTGDMGEVGKELTARTKIANLVNKDLQAKWGKTGLVYDKMMEKWVFPPGFDRAKFWKDYNKLEGIYQKEYGLKPIEKEEKWPTGQFPGKKGERPPLSDFDL